MPEKYRSHASKNKKRIKCKAQRDRDKAAVLEYYGNKCNCCGEREPKFLCMAHVNNDGYADGDKKRRKVYEKIIKLGFPDTYQILCANCNLGKERNAGLCPHGGVIVYGPPNRDARMIDGHSDSQLSLI